MTSSIPALARKPKSTGQKDVFISYKRAQIEFVRALAAALNARGMTTWVDLEDIPFSTEWWQEIREGIDGAGTFLCVISPEYLLESEPCNNEFAYALQQGKKIIPINYEWVGEDQEEALAACTWEPAEGVKAKEISAKANHDKLLKINFIPLQDKVLSSEDAEIIYQTIRTDYAYLKSDAKYHMRSLDWESRGRDAGATLRGAELDDAENWLVKRVEGVEPTPLQIDFIRFSRQAQDKLLRRDRNRLLSLVAAISMGLIVAVALGLLANDQRVLANNREQARATQQFIAEDESEARNNQLQTLVMLDNALSMPVGLNPSDPLLVGMDVWVSNRAENTLMRFSTGDGKPLASLEVGEDPLPPVAGGGYIWTASVRDKTIFRIDPRDNSVQAFSALDDTPQVLLMTNNFLWVVARNLAVQVNMEQGVITKTISLGKEVFGSYYADPYIWLVRTSELIRLDATTGATQTLSLGTRLQTPRLAGGFLWVTDTEQAQLWQLDPDSMTMVGSYSVGAGLSIPKVVDNQLWISSAPQQVFWLDSQTGQTIKTWNLSQELNGAMISAFYVVGGRLWIVSSDSRLLSYSLDGQLAMTIESLPQESSLTEPTWDGSNLWFGNQRTRQILVVHGETGKIIRRLTNCDNPSQLAYDGANMWASCRDDVAPSLVRIPAYLYYHGLGSQRELVDTGISILPEAPIFDGERLWTVQSSDGVLVVFDVEQECVVGVMDVGSDPSPPYFDDEHGRYWISQETTDGQRLEHFIVYYDTESSRLDTCNREALIPEHSFALSEEPGTLRAIGDRLWVNLVYETFTTGDGSSPPDNLELFDLSTGDLLDSMRYGQFVNGIVPNDETSLWLVAPDMTTNNLHRIEAKTGVEQLSIPVDHFPWEPVIIGDDLWVSASFEGGLFNAGPSFFDSSGALYRFDRITGAQEFVIEFDGFMSPAQLMGNSLWMLRSTQMPPVGNYYVRSADKLIAFDPSTESIVHEFSPCKNILPPYYDAATNWVWVSCLGFEHDPAALWVMDASEGTIIQQYEDLGRDAQPLVPIGNTIWIVYRESEYVAVFDAKTAQLRTVLGLGTSPSPPVADDKGHLWIANVGSATLQRIILPENVQ